MEHLVLNALRTNDLDVQLALCGLSAAANDLAELYQDDPETFELALRELVEYTIPEASLPSLSHHPRFGTVDGLPLSIEGLSDAVTKDMTRCLHTLFQYSTLSLRVLSRSPSSRRLNPSKSGRHVSVSWYPLWFSFCFVYCVITTSIPFILRLYLLFSVL